MLQSIRDHVTVQAGGRIEIQRPELHPGTQAEVIILFEDETSEPEPLVKFIGRARGCFTDVSEIDAYIRGERDAWDR